MKLRLKWVLGVVLFLAGMLVGVQEAEAQDKRIYNHHATDNLIIYRSIYTDAGVKVGEKWARLLPGRCTPPGFDWEYAAVEPPNIAILPTWYECGAFTMWNLHYEGSPVFWADVFWCYMPWSHPFNNIGIVGPVWAGWTPNESENVEAGGRIMPPEAYIPLEGAGYIE